MGVLVHLDGQLKWVTVVSLEVGRPVSWCLVGSGWRVVVRVQVWLCSQGFWWKRIIRVLGAVSS